MFRTIDRDKWDREPYFDHYFNQVPCTYSITVNIDITELIRFKTEHRTKLYPLLIYAVAKAVNRYDEFKTAVNREGKVIVWDTVSPCYTVFHEESETFSNLWTEWNDDLTVFLGNFERDISQYGQVRAVDAKPGAPDNLFPLSSLPWTTFTGFNLNLNPATGYLLPIFTYGKYFRQDGKYCIPLSIQVHHAVCDGFHVARFVRTLQRICEEINQ